MVLERLYPWVPVWVQNLGISAYGLAWRHERLGGDFGHYVRQYEIRQWWAEERMRAYIEARLRRVLLHAFEHGSYYRAAWSAHGLTAADLHAVTLEALHRLPLTPKQALRQHPESFVAKGPQAGSRVHQQKTSGSTGTPITALCTSAEHRHFIALREARSFRWAGSSIHRGRAMIGGRLVVPKAVSLPPFHRYNLAEKQVYLSAYHIAPQNAAEYVRALNQYRPPLLTGYANSYFSLARMMLERELSLDYQPQALVLSSEKLTTEMRRVIQQAFQARPYEEYAAVENCSLATECEAGGLHVSPDFGIIEILDASGEPCAAGQEGRIVCTSLVKTAQPLIRYDIEDIGVWAQGTCPCGRAGLPRLREIVGRLEDLVVGPDGREMVRFHGMFVGLPHVAEAQVIQESLDRFTVKLVPHGNFGSSDEELIRRRFGERLGSVSVVIEPVAAIPRSERGKFRAVISKVTRPTGVNEALSYADTRAN